MNKKWILASVLEVVLSFDTTNASRMCIHRRPAVPFIPKTPISPTYSVPQVTSIVPATQNRIELEKLQEIINNLQANVESLTQQIQNASTICANLLQRMRKEEATQIAVAAGTNGGQ